ncbi:MAG: glycosyltransferase family 4 protein [Acidobacteria bacterium]|nr:glycosyltransferase family 4 protein [Acidobacteriota bacterium]
MHILILTDRDWDHPQTGGTGVHLTGMLDHWLEWGHQVTVIAGGYEGAPAHESDGALTVHRFGDRVTVIPETIARGMVGRIPKADVTLEIINGICWMTPLWHRGPCVSLVHHVHKSMYVDEMGSQGRVAGYALETFPLRGIYRRRRFATVSEATKAEMVSEHRLDPDQIGVVWPGVKAEDFAPGPKAPEPTMVFLGRLKRYKRIERLFDVVEAVDGLSLDVVGDGDQDGELKAEARRRGVENRVRFHGHVGDERKAELLSRAWIAATASSAEGWSSATMEAAASGTPTIAHPVGGLKESVVHGETGLHADAPRDLIEAARLLVADAELRERLGRQARARAETLGWERSAEGILAVLASEARQGGPGLAVEEEPIVPPALAGG